MENSSDSLSSTTQFLPQHWAEFHRTLSVLSRKSPPLLDMRCPDTRLSEPALFKPVTLSVTVIASPFTLKGPCLKFQGHLALSHREASLSSSGKVNSKSTQKPPSSNAQRPAEIILISVSFQVHSVMSMLFYTLITALLIGSTGGSTAHESNVPAGPPSLKPTGLNFSIP